MNTQSNIQSIADRTMLVVLQTGAWRAVRLNRTETADVNARHSTDAAKVLVRLTDNPALAALSKLHASAYQAHRRLTLPTIQDGMRLLPSGREFEHADTMRKLHTQHGKLVADFIGAYQSIKADAPARLNGLYDATQWPSVDTVESKFTFQTRYLPCPSHGTWGVWLAESAKTGETELRERIQEALQRLVDRCRETDGKLYQSVFSNLSDLLALVPDLNISECPVIAQAAQQAGELAKLDADAIRDSKHARNQAADKAAQILAAFGGATL